MGKTTKSKKKTKEDKDKESSSKKKKNQKESDIEEDESEEEIHKKKASKKATKKKKKETKSSKKKNDSQKNTSPVVQKEEKKEDKKKRKRKQKNSKKNDDNDESKDNSEDESEKSKEEEKHKIKIQKVISKGGAVVDMYVPDSNKYHVVPCTSSSPYFSGSFYSATLNKSDLDKNNNKFYILQLIQEDNTGDVYFFTRWGRIGVAGQQSLILTDLTKGPSLFFSKYRAKTRGGYQEIAIDYENDEDKEEKESKKTKKKKTKKPKDSFVSPLSKQVEDFIKMIYDLKLMNAQMKEIGYDSNKMPLGKLAKETLNEGYEVLKRIEAVLKGETDESLTVLSSEFYTKIPHNFGFQKISRFIIDSNEKLKEKIEMIESLLHITVATKIISEQEDDGDTTEAKLILSYYNKLHCDIRYIDQKEEIFNLFYKYLLPEGHGHYPDFNIIEAYEVKREGEQEKFDDSIGNKMLLWHGTRITNFVGILSQGLRIAPPEAPSSGYNFGKGLYFADMASKSCWYCYPVNRIGLILLVEVALGKIEKRINTDYNLPKTMGKGYNSILGVGNRAPSGGIKMDDDVFVPNGTINNVPDGYFGANEYIVYNTNQVKLRYILKIKYLQ